MMHATGLARVPRTRIVNINPVERAGRIAIGVAAAIAGIALLAASPSVLAAVFEVVLILAGLDMIGTGLTGHCPLYQKLGRAPRPTRSLR